MKSALSGNVRSKHPASYCPPSIKWLLPTWVGIFFLFFCFLFFSLIARREKKQKNYKTEDLGHATPIISSHTIWFRRWGGSTNSINFSEEKLLSTTIHSFAHWHIWHGWIKTCQPFRTSDMVSPSCYAIVARGRGRGRDVTDNSKSNLLFFFVGDLQLQFGNYWKGMEQCSFHFWNEKNRPSVTQESWIFGPVLVGVLIRSTKYC